jgi:putative lipoprotein
MKKLIVGLCATLVLASCGNDAEKKANERLTTARTAFEQGDYNEAKLQIDSIKILYPKAFDARREGISLIQQIELKEQQQSLVYLDSILQTKQKEFESIKNKYVLEKDAEYQQTGNYFWPTQTVEKNLHRSFLRFQVNEQGVMSMTSIYCGGSNLHHFAVKVIAPDGSFAETPASKDSYETTDLGEKIEKADYKMGADGNVMGFLYLNRDKNIKVEYIGDRKYTTTMTSADRQALAGIYELSQLLSSIEQIKKEQEEANLKIQFVTKKIEQKQQKEATEKETK